MLKVLFLFILLSINPHKEDALKVVQTYGSEKLDAWKDLVELEECQLDSIEWGWQMSDIVKQSLWIYHPEYYDGGWTIWDLNAIDSQKYKIYSGLVTGLKLDASKKKFLSLIKKS